MLPDQTTNVHSVRTDLVHNGLKYKSWKQSRHKAYFRSTIQYI